MDTRQQQMTLSWLGNTFELHAGSSMARRDVYKQYVTFCQNYGLQPTTAAIFGKMVRMVYPSITSRRLGKRGANVVHYYNFRQKPDDQVSSTAASSSSATTTSSTTTSSTTTLKAKPSQLNSISSLLSQGDISPAAPRMSTPKRSHGSFSLSAHPHPSTVAAAASTLLGLSSPNRAFHSHAHGDYKRPIHLNGVKEPLQGYILPQPGLQPIAPAIALPPLSGLVPLVPLLPSPYRDLDSDLRRRESWIDSSAGEGEESATDPTPRSSASNVRSTSATTTTSTAMALQSALARVQPNLRNSQNELNEVVKRPVVMPEGSRPFPSIADSDMDDPYNEASTAAMQRAQQIDEAFRLQRESIGPSSDTSLYIMAIASNFMHHYRHSVWVVSPLHPAAMNEDNVRYLLCTEEGAEERSALSLNVYFALCMGALVSGHIKSAREFYLEAKEHLSFVFDSTDYAIAEALLPMSFSLRFFTEADDQGLSASTYYVTLASQICKRLGALNSDVYMRSVKRSMWLGLCEKDRLIRAGVEAEPFAHTPTVLQGGEEILPSLKEELQRHPSFDRLRPARKTHKLIHAIQSSLFHIFEAIVYLRMADMPLRKALRDLYRAPGSTSSSASSSSSSSSSPAKDLSSSPNVDDVAANQHKLTARLENLLRRCESALNDLMTSEEHCMPKVSYMQLKLLITGERIACRWLLGDVEGALCYSTTFLDILRKDATNIFLLDCQHFFELVVDVFAHTQRLDEYHDLLLVLEPLASVVPSLQRARLDWAHRLHKMSKGRNVDGSGS